MLVSSALTALLLALLLYGRFPALPLAVFCLALPLALCLLHRSAPHSHTGAVDMDVLAHRSRLYGWNTGLKVCTSLTLLVSCIAANSLVVAAAVFLLTTAVNLAAGRLSLVRYLSLLALPLTFVALSGLALVVDVSPAPLGLLDVPLGARFLSLTPAGQAGAALVIARAMGAVGCLYTLSLSTPVYEITAFLRRAHLPAIMVELMVLVYRYIFVLMASMAAMTTATQARLGYRGYRATWRSFTGIATNLLARSFARAGRSFDAMEARGYDGEIRFLEPAKPLRAGQVAGAVGLAALPAAVLLVERGLL